MPRRWKNNKADEINIARARIDLLYKHAKSIYQTDIALANRYIEIALRIAERMRIKLPTQYKRTICRKCKKLLLGRSRVRVRQNRQSHMVVTCKNCGFKTRYIINKEKSTKNKDQVLIS